MTPFLSWPDRMRAFVGSSLSEPLYGLFSLFPQCEIGLSSHSVSRLTYAHRVLAGHRAVHLSDLHLDRFQPRHERILATVGELQPHWIFVTGDLLNVPKGLPHLFRFLAGLREMAPVYLTLGNHDHYSGVPIEQFSAWAERHDVTLLVNQTAFLTTDRGELAVAGVDAWRMHSSS